MNGEVEERGEGEEGGGRKSTSTAPVNGMR